MRDTDSDWKRVALDDPYWGVLSEDVFRKERMDETGRQLFMASGEAYVSNLFSLIEKYLVPNFVPSRSIDFGCGVGRLAIPMCKRSGEVIGVDVAPAMLLLCQRNAKEANVKNLTLCVSDDDISAVHESVDFFNTYIVMQHIPPPRGYKIIESLMGKLRVGGVGSLQLTYAKSRKFMAHEEPKALYYRREGGVLIDIVDSGWNHPEGTINMFDYDLNQVMAQLSRFCGHPLIVLPTNDDSHLGVHFIFQKAR
jgi:SAM-dependent methyltransferase